MKKYSILLGAVLGSLALASCQKEAEIVPTDNADQHIPFALKADVPETRTAFDAATWEMSWENNDVIYAVTTDGLWGLPYGEDNEGTSIADFVYSDGSFATDLTIADGEHTFNFLYTANESQRSYHRSASTSFSLSAFQSEDASSPTAALKLNDALAGQVTATTPTDFVNVSMDHLFTLMKVTLKNKTGDAITIKKFEISATEATLAGIYTVTFGETPSIEIKSGKKSFVSVNVTNGEIAANGELPVFFVMAPLDNYSGSITFTAEDENGIVYTKTNAVTGVTFEAGKYNTANFSLKATPTMILNPESLETFSKDGGTQTITVTTFQFAGTPVITAESDNPVFATSVSNGVVTVSVDAHTTDLETGTLTITATSGEQVVSKTLALEQESGLTYADKTFFMETFGGTDSSLGTGSAVFASDNVGWVVANAYLAGEGGHSARFGKGSSGKGSATTPSIVIKNDVFDYSGAELKLTFKAAAWDNAKEKTSLKVFATGATLSGSALSNGQVTTVKGEWTDYELAVSGFTGTSFTITFEGLAADNARFYLDEVYVYYGATPKLDPGIGFEKEEYSAIIGEAFTAPTLINPHNVSVTYSSSDPNVATVNSSTGAVTITGQTEGASATITASFAGDDTYAQATASYVITLAKKPAGGTVLFVAGTDTSASTSITKDGVTITLSSGTLSRTDNYRVYAGATMTISCPDGLNITDIQITTVTAEDNNATQLSTTTGTYSVSTSGDTGTWKGSANSVVFASAKQCRMNQIEVTYK